MKPISYFYRILIFTCICIGGTASAQPAPTISGFSPTNGAVGTLVTITGTDFNAGGPNDVYFGGVMVTANADAGGTSIAVNVPAGASSVSPIVVRNNASNLQASSINSTTPMFTVTNTPTLPVNGFNYPVANYSTSGRSDAFAVGDLNKDGKPDIVATSFSSPSSSVIIMLNNGSGGFPAGTPMSTAAQPSDVAIGDITNDGNLDIVVAHSGTSSLYLLTGNGAGVFSPTGVINGYGGNVPTSVALADMNRDGRLDIVTTHSSGDALRVQLQSGAGTFLGTFSANITTGNQPQKPAIGDFNNDGFLDVATTQSGNITTYFNDGIGGLALNSNYGLLGIATDVRTADMDNDGFLDLAIGYASGASQTNVSVFYGQAGGAFGTRQDIPTGITSVQGIAIADLNGDNILDLVTGSYSGTNQISIMRGIGGRAFAAGVLANTGVSANHALEVADFNTDGKADIAVSRLSTNNIGVFLYSTNEFHSIGPAAWNVPGNWSNSNGGPDCGCSPNGASNATVFVGHAVTVPTASNIGTNNSIELLTGGILNLQNGNAVPITSLITNFGSDINLAAGSLNLSNPAGTTINGTLRNASSATTPIPNNLTFGANGVYIHDKDGGVIPTATWNSGSHCIVQGITNTAIVALPAVQPSFNQNFWHFTWDCAGQVVSQTINANMVVQGDFRVLNTNTGNLTLATSGNFVLTADNLIINPLAGNNARFFLANSAFSGTVDLKGNFNDGISPLGTAEFGLVGTGSATAQILFTGTNNQFFNPPVFVSGGQSNYRYNIGINKTGPNDRVFFIPTSYTFLPIGALSNTITVTNGVFSISRNTPQNIDMGEIRGAGTLEMLNESHILNIYGQTNDIANLVTDVSDTQIYYMAAGNQDAFASNNYRTVGFRGSGTKTLFGSSIINKNLLIDTGAELNATLGTPNIVVHGDWLNHGLFAGPTSTVSFEGVNPQILGGTSTTIFHNLTINNSNPSGVLLDQPVTVNNTLTLTAGKLFLNNDLLANGTLNAAAGAYIVADGSGALARFVGAPDVLYPIGTATLYTPVTLFGGDGSRIHANININIPNLPAGATDVAAGAWIFNSPANTYRIRFDVSGSVSATSKIRKYDGASLWFEEATTFSVTPSPNYTTTNLQTTGMNTYSVFTTAAPVITITPATLPDGDVNVFYSQSLSATGGMAPYGYTIISGTLPSGVSLSSSGVLSGTPILAGAYNFTVEAIDGAANVGTKDYTWNVLKAPQTVIPSSFVYVPNASNSNMFVLSAAASSGLNVEFLSTNPDVARIINGDTLEILDNYIGEADIKAYQAGDNNFQKSDTVMVMRIDKFGLISGVETELEKQIMVYPSPMQGEWMYIVTTNSQIQVNQASLTNAWGLKIPVEIHAEAKGLKVSLKDLQSGIYFINMHTNRGILTKKLIKL